MREFAVFDTNFNATKISSYLLLIQLDINGLAYTIVDPIRKHFLAQVRRNFKNNDSASLTDKVKNIVEKEPYLSKRYKKINFVFVSNKYTLLPKEFFDKKLIRQIFKANHPLDNSEEVHFNVLDSDIYVLFSIYSDLLVYLVDKFPEINFFSQITPLINYAIKTNKILVNVYPNYADIITAKQNKLTFANSFPISNPKDLIYLIPKVLKENNINFENANVFIVGDLEGQVELIKSLNSFIPNLRFFTKYSYEYKLQIPAHYLFALNMSVYL